MAQRAFEVHGRVVYEDNQKQQTNLGVGFNPLLTEEGKVALIRGRRYEYGNAFDCHHNATKNRIALYDPTTKLEKIIFNRALNYGFSSIAYCVFEQMQMSHDGSTLYLVSPVYATSGSLAIVNLARGSVAYVPGVNLVYVIESGPRRDELIYVRRVMHDVTKDGVGAAYPFIHARADGAQITEISNEDFNVGVNDKLPILRAYLRKIDATITVSGRKLP